MNASSWPMFLLRTLNGAEMAPATAFKKVCDVPKSCENVLVAAHVSRNSCTEAFVLVPGTDEAHPEQL